MFRRLISVICVITLLVTSATVLSVPSYAASRVFYVDSVSGSDSSDGLSMQNAWKTLSNVNSYSLLSGDTVMFACGSVFRGSLQSKQGVTYTNYGEGEKPTFLGSDDALAYGSWSQTATNSVWVYSEVISLDVGNIVFDGGEHWGYKQITGVNGFTDESALCSDLQFWHSPSDNKVYLFSKVSPALRFDSIELCKKQHIVIMASGATYDGLQLLYGGAHGFSGTNISSCTIRNCEIGWIGGSIQYDTIRYGNGIEFWISCSNILVENNYVYQCYDAGLTHQVSSDLPNDASMTNVIFQNNTIEYCTYSYEYFLTNSTGTMSHIRFTGNTCRHAGLGFGAQRPDISPTSHINSWTTQNTASDFVISGNSFEGSTRGLFNIDSTDGTFPVLSGNTYLQYDDSPLWENIRSLGAWGGTNYIYGSSAAQTLLSSIDSIAVTGFCLPPVDPAAGQLIIDSIFGSIPATAENFSRLYKSDVAGNQVNELLGFSGEAGLCDYMDIIYRRTSVDFNILRQEYDACVSALEALVPQLVSKSVFVTFNNDGTNSVVKYFSGDTYSAGTHSLTPVDEYGIDFNGWQIDSNSFSLQSGFGVSSNAIHGSETDAALPDSFSVSVADAYYLNCQPFTYSPTPQWEHVFVMDDSDAPLGVVLINTDNMTDLSETGLTMTVSPTGAGYYPRQIMSVTTDYPGITVSAQDVFICGNSYTEAFGTVNPAVLNFSGDIPDEPTQISIYVSVRAYHPTWSYGCEYGVNYVETTVCMRLWLLPRETTVLSGYVDGENTVLPFEHTLIANKTALEGTITFDANGGECPEQSRSFVYGQNLGTLPVPTKEHYIFDGWRVSPSLGDRVCVTSDAVFGENDNAAIRNNYSAELRNVGLNGSATAAYSPPAQWQSSFVMSADDAPCAVIAVSPSNYSDLSQLPLDIYIQGFGDTYYPRQVFEASTDNPGIMVSGCSDYIVGRSQTSVNGREHPVTYKLTGAIPSETCEITISIGVRAYHPTWTTDNDYGVFYVESTVKIRLLIIVTESATVVDGSLPALACDHTLTAQWRSNGEAQRITLLGLNNLNVGDTTELNANIYPIEASGAVLTWSSSAPETVSVNSNGVINALTPGTATITVRTANGVTSSLIISVRTPDISYVNIVSPSGSFDVKVNWWKKYSSVPLHLTYVLRNINVPVRVVWSSDSSSVTVDKNGVVTNTRSSARSANITVTLYDAQGNHIADSTVKVCFYKFSRQRYRLLYQRYSTDGSSANEAEATMTNRTDEISYILEDYIFGVFEVICQICSVFLLKE